LQIEVQRTITPSQLFQIYTLVTAAWLSLQDVGLLFSPWLVLTTILNETRDVTGIFAAAFTPTRTNT
jgi:hypothetical protein